MAARWNGLTYAEAGVDIDAGNRMVELIKPLVKATARPGADAGRLDPGQVEVGEEVIRERGPGGEVGDRREDPLTRDVDLGLGSDRAHRAAILVAGPPARTAPAKLSDAAAGAR